MSEALAVVPETDTNGLAKHSQPKKIYLSAPPSLDTRAIRAALTRRGTMCFSADELDSPGKNLAEIFREGIDKADVVVAVVDPTAASSMVLFELGLARAVGKPIFLFLTGDMPLSPWLSLGMPYLRYEPENPAGLEFGVDQILSFPHHDSKPSGRLARTRPIGRRADELLAQLHTAGDAITETVLLQIVEQAVHASGATAVAHGRSCDEGVDLVVWSDDLLPWVTNPLPIEIRMSVRNQTDLHKAALALLPFGAAPTIICGLLIYSEAEIDIDIALAPVNILHISVEKLLEALRTTGFGDVVRRLRSERLHGVP